MDEKQTQGLDYTSLQGTVTEDMRTQFFVRYPKYRKLNGKSVAIGSFVVIWSFIGVVALASGRFNFLALPIGAFIGVISAAAYFGWKKLLDRQVRLQDFADRNGLTYKFDQKEPAYAGLIFGQGHSRNIIEALVFPGYEVGNYQYVTGSGKNRQIHDYGYIKLNLQRPIPHIVLDAKQNDLFGTISNLPVSFSRSQTLELEGDFSKHFTVYVPETYERDALYILTPDVMASLIDESSPYDLEALGNELYLYRGKHFDLTSPKDYESIVNHINALNTEFVDQASGYKDDRVSFSAQAVAWQSTKLRTRTNPLTIMFGVLIFLFFVFYVFYGFSSVIIPVLTSLNSL